MEGEEFLGDFRCYDVDDYFTDCFDEFIYHLGQLDLSKKTLNHIYDIFIKDMNMYFENRKKYIVTEGNDEI